MAITSITIRNSDNDNTNSTNITIAVEAVTMAITITTSTITATVTITMGSRVLITIAKSTTRITTEVNEQRNRPTSIIVIATGNH